jgi:hypothetical protein
VQPPRGAPQETTQSADETADMVAVAADHRRKSGGRTVRILGRARTRYKAGSVEQYDRPMRADLSLSIPIAPGVVVFARRALKLSGRASAFV